MSHSIGDDWDDDATWRPIVQAIKHQICTPFIGAGASFPTLPLGSEIARCWAQACGYPFEDTHNLPKVAQYRSVLEDDMTPKLELIKHIREVGEPNFDDPLEPHRFLADLKQPLYFTTNYDHFMSAAIMKASQVRPLREYCRWRKELNQNTVFKAKNMPKAEKPLVYHLHGVSDLQMIDENNPYNMNECWRSLVLTEDDYLQFINNLSEDKDLFPQALQSAFTNTSVLFLGYSLQDLNFKVILRRIQNYFGLRGSSGPRHIAVQLVPSTPKVVQQDRFGCSDRFAEGRCMTKENCRYSNHLSAEACKDHDAIQTLGPSELELEWVQKVKTYFAREYGMQNIHVFWGTSRDFCEALAKKL